MIIRLLRCLLLSVIMASTFHKTAQSSEKYLNLRQFADIVNGKVLDLASNSVVVYFAIRDGNLVGDLYVKAEKQYRENSIMIVQASSQKLCIVPIDFDFKTRVDPKQCGFHKRAAGGYAKKIGNDWHFREMIASNLNDYVARHYAAAAKPAVKQEPKPPASPWASYNSREKTLIEEVLNYSTAGATEGTEDLYWIQEKGGCAASRVGDVNGIVYFGLIEQGYALSLPERINVSDLLEKGFEIRPKSVYAAGATRPIYMFEFSDGRTHFSSGYIGMPVTSEPPSMARLRKAWQLAFQECPGKKSRF